MPDATLPAKFDTPLLLAAFIAGHCAGKDSLRMNRDWIDLVLGTLRWSAAEIEKMEGLLRRVNDSYLCTVGKGERVYEVPSALHNEITAALEPRHG